MKKEVLIIGGGLSGLTIAYQLEKQQVPYRLVEARERLGGRIKTQKVSFGGTIEMGATWFSDKHRNLIQLATELGIPYERQYIGTKALYDYRNPGRVVEEIKIPIHQESSYVFSNGTAHLTEALYARLDPEKVYLGERVNLLSFQRGLWKVVTCKRVFDTNLVINTTPPNLFVNTVKIEPQVPPELMELSKATHTWMGESIKVGGAFSSPLWREKSIGTFFSQFGPGVELHDHMHVGKNHPILMGFMDPYFHPMPREERATLFAQQMAFYFQDASFHLREYHEVDWQEEKLTYHPYAQEVVPHQNNGHKMLRRLMYDGHLYFAGSETAKTFPGYMDGAVERALETAEEIKQLAKDRLQYF